MHVQRVYDGADVRDCEGALVRRCAGARVRTCAHWLAAVALIVAAISSSAPSAQQSSPAQSGAASPSFDRLYDEGQLRNASMKTLTARFTETTTSSLLVRPLVARGTLAVERPSRVALRYTEPDARVIIIDDKTLTTTWPSKQAMDIGAAMGRVQKQFVNGSAASLRREFDIDDRHLVDTPGAYYVSMVPKRKQILEGLTKLDLWVDRQSLLLKSMRMTFPSGEAKTMTFEDVVPNAALPAGVFTLPTRR